MKARYRVYGLTTNDPARLLKRHAKLHMVSETVRRELRYYDRILVVDSHTQVRRIYTSPPPLLQLRLEGFDD